jgi:branched-subunit amino acid ABC-type transport system permease component
MRILLLGLVAGSIYSLSAVALVLVYRATGVLNFAQGAVGMLGTFTFIFAAAHQPRLLAVVLGLVVAAALGAVLGGLTGLLGEHRLEATVLTLGALGLLQALAQVIFGGHPVALATNLFPTGALRIGGALIGTDEVIAALLALAICGGVIALVGRTRLGLVARAVASRPQVVAALGLDERPILLISWVVASVLAAASGLFLLTVQPAPDTVSLTLTVIESFAAALVGRLVSLPGALAGGLLIGLISQAAELGIGVPGAGEAAVFGAMIVLLTVLPPRPVRGAQGAAAAL